MQFTFTVQTPAHSAFVEITEQVRSFIRQEDLESGMIVVYIPHTTAGITINENADPNVVRDLLADLDRLIPQHQSYYRHYEGNSAAHLKASIIGASITVVVGDGKTFVGDMARYLLMLIRWTKKSQGACETASGSSIFEPGI